MSDPIRYLGIDPGLSGALCVLSIFPDKSTDVWFSEFPQIDGEPDWHGLRKILIPLQDCFGVLEKVHAMPKQGVSSMFKFGRVYGGLQAALSIFQIRHLEVTPQTWQKEMHENLSKDLDAKKRSLIAVQRLFPDVNLLKSERSKKPHDGFVDALLLAEYGRRKVTPITPSILNS